MKEGLTVEATNRVHVVATQDAMAVPYPPISDSAVMQALDINRQRAALHGWIYGPETGKSGSESMPEVVPAITVSWSWAGEAEDPGGSRIAMAEGLPRKLAWNAHSIPESADEDTPHSFHHAQPTARRMHRGNYLEGVRLPLHESVPASPQSAGRAGWGHHVRTFSRSMAETRIDLTMLSHDLIYQ